MLLLLSLEEPRLCVDSKNNYACEFFAGNSKAVNTRKPDVKGLSDFNSLIVIPAN
jgi:hypothetical protein